MLAGLRIGGDNPILAKLRAAARLFRVLRALLFLSALFALAAIRLRVARVLTAVCAHLASDDWSRFPVVCDFYAFVLCVA